MDKQVFSGKNLINSSRWVHFIIHVPVYEIEHLCVRLEEVTAENPALCTPENFTLMSNASVALVLFEMFRNRGDSFLEAYYHTARPMWEYCQEEAYRVYKKTKSKNAFRKISGRIEEKIRTESGPYADIEAVKESPSCIRLICRKCFYDDFFGRYYLKDIGAMFCYADNIILSAMKNIGFNLEKTLILDKTPCEAAVTDILI